jgi:hypothetical protein
MHRSVLLARRFSVLAALMFWQGGFTFYAAIVVPIGTDVLGSAAEQARVTRLVALNLNIVAAISLVLLAWDIVATRSRRSLYWSRWLLWLGMAICLMILLFVYPQLDRLFHGEEAFLDRADRATFKPLHRFYLWVTTTQWSCALLFVLLTLESWRSEDHGWLPPRLREGKAKTLSQQN